jgi:hypothetical protein
MHKRPTTSLHLRPELVAAVAARGVPLAEALEQGLELWLARDVNGASAAASAPEAVPAPAVPEPAPPTPEPALPWNAYRPPGGRPA